MNQSSYCPAIYRGLYVEKTGTIKTNISSCCLNSSIPITTDVDFNHPVLVEQRTQISAGIQIPACNQCWKKEKHGYTSRRITLIEQEKFKSHNTQLTMLDYNVGPICNAKCIICSSFYSSAWAAENYQFGMNPIRQVSEIQKNHSAKFLDLSNIKDIYFNGGEPLMTDDHVQILNSINQQSKLSDVNISYNTNGSIVPSIEVLNLWRKCKQVKLYFSIDGIDSVFDYTRYPLKWSNVQKNISAICNSGLTNLKVSISYTIGVHNVLSTFDTEKWMNKIKEKFPLVVEDFTVHPVLGDLSLDNTSNSLKEIFIKHLQSINSNWVESTLKMIEERLPSSSDNLIWLNYLKFIDQRRNLNWQQELPLLHQALKISGSL
jgi:uncharacterized radical SAM superfamily Fe-S cluster-containing enzyme